MRFRIPQSNGQFSEERIKNDWAVILKVSPDASMSEIRASYLRLIRLFHPDRIAWRDGINIADAEHAARLVNAAYAEAKKRRSNGAD